MDAQAYLLRHGWSGPGNPLNPNKRPGPHGGLGLTKPLLAAKKSNTHGLGKKTNADPKNQWWLRGFEDVLKGVGTEDRAGDQTQGSGVGSARAGTALGSELYRFFVRGEGLRGTIGDDGNENGRKRKRGDEEEEEEERKKVKKESKGERRRRKQEKREKRERKERKKAKKSKKEEGTTDDSISVSKFRKSREKTRPEEDYPTPVATEPEPDSSVQDESEDKASRSKRRKKEKELKKTKKSKKETSDEDKKTKSKKSKDKKSS